MKRARYTLISILVLTALACGGGGGEKSDAEKYPGLVRLVARDPVLPGPTYRAVFSVTGSCAEEGMPEQDVVGECVLYTEGSASPSPFNGLTGVSYRKDWDLDVEGTRIAQTECEYLYQDSDGAIWSLGGRLPDGTEYFWYSSSHHPEDLDQVEGLVLLYLPVIEVGTLFHHRATARTRDGAPLFSESGQTEYLDELPQTTGLGWHEVFLVHRGQSRYLADGPTTQEGIVYSYRPDKNILAHNLVWWGRIGLGGEFEFHLNLELRSLEK